MQLTTDTGELTKTAIIILAVVALVGFHLSVAFRIGRKTRGVQTVVLLAGLSLGTAIAWYVIGYVISLMLILSKPSSIVTNGVSYRSVLLDPT
jgi:hypothetical protein